MPDNNAKSFFHEYGILMLILTVVALLGAVSYYIALSRERSAHRAELTLINQIQHSGAKPEDLAPLVEGEIQRLHEDQFWIGILHHISTALIISFVVILSVELHTRRLSRKDLEEHLEAVKQNVWNALGKRLLGPLIATELEAIMKEIASKEQCQYVLTFKRPEFAEPPDRVIVSMETSFKLRSLSDVRDRDSTYPFRCNISGYEKTANLPRYTIFKNGTKEELNPVTEKENPAVLKRDIELPHTPEDRAEVAVGIELAYKLRDSESYITEVPIEGLTVTLINLVPDLVSDLKVAMLHRCDEIKHPTSQTWNFDRALLPGQGFAVSWSAAPPLLKAAAKEPPINQMTA